MVERILRLKIAVDVLLFVGSAVLLAYLAQRNYWLWFSVVAVVCTALYTLLRFAESAKALRALRSRAGREGVQPVLCRQGRAEPVEQRDHAH